MKTFKILSAIIIAVVCVSLSSCSKDDSGQEESKSSIVGKWQLVTNKGARATHVSYNSNGTFEYTSSKETSYSEKGTYKIEGTKLYEKFSDEPDWFMSEIVLLNSTTLTVQELEDDGITPDGKPYSYQRIK